jgi:hypothetical protein
MGFDDGGQEVGNGGAGGAKNSGGAMTSTRYAQREKAGRALIEMHPDPQRRMTCYG